VTKERRLGRGLEALLGQIPSRSGGALPAQYPAAGSPSAASGGELTAASAGTGLDAATLPPAEPLAAAGPLRLEISRIDSNPAQPRQEYDAAEMQSLAESLSTHGLLQPVVVRRVGERYQLIAGERRLRAAVQAGWTDVPANVIEADDREVAELAIIENLHRKDLNPLEKAQSFQRYLEEYGSTQEELAKRLNIDRSTIANLIRLLELPNAVQDAIRKGSVTQGHARALLPLGEENEQVAFCERIQREGLSVRQTEAMVQETIDAVDAEPLSVIDRDGKQRRPRRGQNEQLAALEQEFRTALGLKVKITANARGRGRLVVQFRNHEEFEHLREYICAEGGANLRSHAG
jgi:ParB family transcriptional regulator, chromosome partitioning protein